MSAAEPKGPRFLTVRETAELFRAGGRWVYWAASQGVLRPCARRIGRKLLFDRLAIEKLIEEQARK